MIRNLSTVKEGDRVSYEDMANPRRVGIVRSIVDQGWGTQFHVLLEDGELTYSDLRQHGWKREPSACRHLDAIGHPGYSNPFAIRVLAFMAEHECSPIVAVASCLQEDNERRWVLRGA